jgi:hypothetical protein
MAGEVRLGIVWSGKACPGGVRQARQNTKEVFIMVYQWKSGSRIKANPEEAGKQFEELAETVGLTAETVLDANRPENAPLHGEFEWRDDIAAEEWRKHQARHLINCICYTVEHQDNNAQVRAFFTTPETNGYESLEAIVTVENKYNSLLVKAMQELSAFERKYSTLKELKPVFDAIKEVTA